MINNRYANDYMKNQIWENLRLRETSDLLEIWRLQDREEWTEEAFQVVKDILEERLGEIPTRDTDKPMYAARKLTRKPEASDQEAQAPSPAAIRDFMRQNIYDTMDAEDTETLLEIWKENDREQWVKLTFDVIHQILLERLGSVPAQRADENQPAPVEPDGEALPAFLREEDAPLPLVGSLLGLRCSDCGKEISEGDSVCPHCGADLETPLSPAELAALAAGATEKAQRKYEHDMDFHGALADCEEALEYTPNSAALHNLRGLILDALEKTALAVKEYKEALRLDPNLTDAQDNLRDAEAELSGFQY